MSVKKYLETTAVFTIDEFRSRYPTVTDNNLFTRAAKSGKVLGVAHSVNNKVQYFSSVRRKNVEFQGSIFKRYSGAGKGWSKRWKLILPAPAEAIERWL